MRIRIVLSFLTTMICGLVFSQNRFSREDYINKYHQIAIDEMKSAGIPASITLAQGILESNSGNSLLAKEANNHFGIKCHSDWTGQKFYYDDDKPNECFRKYKKAEQSFHDRSEFLTKQSRYKFLFDYEVTDYKSWAKGLKKAGYATNKDYAEMLIKIIEENELYKYDNKNYKASPNSDLSDDTSTNGKNGEDVINPFKNDVLTYNRIDYVIVKQGDTFKSIVERHEVMLWQLYKYNELSKSAKLVPDTRMYLQPKRRKAAIEDKYYTISEGEKMYDVSQKFGIKMKHLYKKNGIQMGTEPEPGTKLYLRKKKKTP